MDSILYSNSIMQLKSLRMPRISIRWMLPHGKKTMGRKYHQKQPLKKDYGYIKEKLISSIHKGITIAEIKGRDKSPFFRRIIHFFTFLYSVGVKEYILLNVLQK